MNKWLYTYIYAYECITAYMWVDRLYLVNYWSLFEILSFSYTFFVIASYLRQSGPLSNLVFKLGKYFQVCSRPTQSLCPPTKNKRDKRMNTPTSFNRSKTSRWWMFLDLANKTIKLAHHHFSFRDTIKINFIEINFQFQWTSYYL